MFTLWWNTLRTTFYTFSFRNHVTGLSKSMRGKKSFSGRRRPSLSDERPVTYNRRYHHANITCFGAVIAQLILNLVSARFIFFYNSCPRSASGLTWHEHDQPVTACRKIYIPVLSHPVHNFASMILVSPITIAWHTNALQRNFHHDIDKCQDVTTLTSYRIR